MPNNTNPEIRRQFARMLTRIAERVERDEQFAEWLLEGMAVQGGRKTNRTRKQKTVGQEMDIFTIYAQDGVEALREELNRHDPQALKGIVLSHGLDPVGKVRRWKSKDRIVAFIIDVVSKQMSKGRAFQNP